MTLGAITGGREGRVCIYHGTPLTPRAALTSVCAGRAMCVSFYRPDDVEAVEAISPAIMFRQWRVLVLAGRNARRTRVGRDAGLDALFRMAGAAPVPSRPVGRHARYAGGAEPAQRHAAADLAIRAERRASLAHGRAVRAPAAPLRSARPCLPRLDRAEGRITGLSLSHGRSGCRARQSLAGAAHAARDSGGVRLSLRQRGQHLSGAERVAL